MTSPQALKRWMVNVISFVLFSLLAVTGLLNWLLPRGYRGGGGFLQGLHHAVREIHQLTAVLFVIVVLVHLALHWTYIRSNLQRQGILK